jgi:hypothetical protein
VPDLPGPGQTISYDAHVKPLFRPLDRESMHPAFDLWSYDEVSAHADVILARLSSGTMPCDGPWPEANVAVFRRWVDTGKAR